MALRVRCPLCWETAEISEEMLGRRGVCNSCGASVEIPTRLNKVCFVCGEDVADVKHAKDQDNNYLCAKCWQARNQKEQELFTAAEEPVPAPVAVPVVLAPVAVKPRAARGGNPGWALLCILSLVGTGVLAVAHFRRPSWEEENRVKIIVLKAQAEVLAEVGKGEAAVGKYRELFRLVDGRVIESSELNAEMKQAREEYRRIILVLAEKSPGVIVGGTTMPATTPSRVQTMPATMPIRAQTVPATAPSRPRVEEPAEKPPVRSIFD